jgi:hypothetical protein
VIEPIGELPNNKIGFIYPGLYQVSIVNRAVVSNEYSNGVS